MLHYLLLRNNKESGPYTLNDLVSTGLKPYDLIWVEGKSAAWRYASEVTELKAYAPQVEEQPFERFFKKSPERTTEARPPVQPAPPSPPAPDIEEKYRAYVPQKSVAVTLPDERKSMPENPRPAGSPAISVTENPAAAQVKYAQPLDEIKDMYVRTLQERKNRLARKNIVVKNLKRAAVIAGLLSIGVLAGMIINAGPDKKTHTIAGAQAASPVLPDEPVTASPDIPEETQQSGKEPARPPSPSLTPSKDLSSGSVFHKRELTSPENGGKEEAAIPPAQPQREIAADDKKIAAVNAKTDPVTGVRSRTQRTGDGAVTAGPAAAANEQLPRGKINAPESDVTVSSNDYKRVAFGGIRNLELTVTNRSKHALDQVIVELQYLKPSAEPLRTERISFSNISPGGSRTKRIADTNRGVNILYKIVEIQPSASDTAAAGF